MELYSHGQYRDLGLTGDQALLEAHAALRKRTGYGVLEPHFYRDGSMAEALASAAKDPKLIAKAAEEAAAAKAVRDAEDAKCPRWATVCTIGRHPDGSEKTTGQQTFATKAQCEGAGASVGLKCDPCRCFN